MKWILPRFNNEYSKTKWARFSHSTLLLYLYLCGSMETIEKQYWDRDWCQKRRELFIYSREQYFLKWRSYFVGEKKLFETTLSSFVSLNTDQVNLGRLLDYLHSLCIFIWDKLFLQWTNKTSRVTSFLHNAAELFLLIPEKKIIELLYPSFNLFLSSSDILLEKLTISTDLMWRFQEDFKRNKNFGIRTRERH